MAHIETLTCPTARPAERTGILSLFALWRSRRTLATLSAQQLQDIGISPRSAHQEARRPLWDVPANWRD